jgi:hypothetical protein
MADVFISYSRKDTAFVRRLHDALAARNRDTWVDWEDIPLTAEWWSEIQRGIEAADTFVFVISPDSARSKMCFDEVEHAHRNNKRIVPILHREVTEEPDQERLHWAISRHNWAFFRAEDDFDAAFDKLIDALDTDLDHVKRHTDLLLRARNWDAICARRKRGWRRWVIRSRSRPSCTRPTSWRAGRRRTASSAWFWQA